MVGLSPKLGTKLAAKDEREEVFFEDLGGEKYDDGSGESGGDGYGVRSRVTTAGAGTAREGDLPDVLVLEIVGLPLLMLLLILLLGLLLGPLVGLLKELLLWPPPLPLQLLKLAAFSSKMRELSFARI